jgi:hypothetical protein
MDEGSIPDRWPFPRQGEWDQPTLPAFKTDTPHLITPTPTSTESNASPQVTIEVLAQLQP